MPDQELIGGTLNKFDADHPDPTEGNIIFLGEHGCGKSHLVQSNPRAVILNFDQTIPVYTNANVRDRMWPDCLGDTPAYKKMEPVNAIKNAQNWLKTLDRTQYSTVVIDSLGEFRELMMDHLAETRGKAKGKADFFDMGQDGWKYLNAYLFNFVHDLNVKGWAVHILEHVHETWAKDGNGEKMAGTNRYEPSISEGGWQKIKRKPSGIYYVKRTPGQRVKNRTTNKFEETPSKIEVTSVEPKLKGYLKDRYNFPTTVELTARDTWANWISHAHTENQ